jgi:hypothetical protein
MAQRRDRGVSGALHGAGGAAGGALKKTGGAARGATSAVSGVTGAKPVDDLGEQVEEATHTAGDVVEGAGDGEEQLTVREELREIVRDAALEVLAPVARRLTTEAAMYALRKGPELARDTLAPKLADTLGPAIEQAGGPGAFAKGALSSVSSARSGMLERVGLGRESESRPWRERRLPVEESIDVVAPLETAFERFTAFDEYANLLVRGETIEERPNERITWRQTDGVDATAVISFHRLSDRLTRVMVTYDRQPQGLFERTASLFSTASHGLNADLMRFKAFVEMSEEDAEEPEEPRRRGAQARTRKAPGKRRAQAEAEEEEEEEPAEAEPDELEDEYEEEPEGEYEDEEEPEYEEEAPEGEYIGGEYEEEEQEAEEPEEPPPAPSRPARRRAPARPRKQATRRR